MDNYFYKYIKYKEKYKQLKTDIYERIRPLFIGARIPPKMKNIHKFTKIKICTYNIWTDDKLAAYTFQEKRMPYILDEITKNDADIICLQDVSPLALNYFLEQQTLTNNYYFLDIIFPGPPNNSKNLYVLFKYKPREILKYNNMILIIYPNLIVINVQLHNGSLDDIHELIKTYYDNNKIIIVGDINYDYNDINLQSDKFTDCWTKNNPNVIGNTSDTTVNKMKWNFNYTKEEIRSDIILYKGNKIRPIETHLIGIEPKFMINKNDPIFDKYLIDNNMDKKYIKLTNGTIQMWASIKFGLVTSFDLYK